MFYFFFIRHSRFGGTYVVENMKAIGENQLICHKPFETIEALEFSRNKVCISSFIKYYKTIAIFVHVFYACSVLS